MQLLSGSTRDDDDEEESYVAFDCPLSAATVLFATRRKRLRNEEEEEVEDELIWYSEKGRSYTLLSYPLSPVFHLLRYILTYAGDVLLQVFDAASHAVADHVFQSFMRYCGVGELEQRQRH